MKSAEAPEMLEQKDFFISCWVEAKKPEAAGSFAVFTAALIVLDERWSLYRENTKANVVSCERRQNNFTAISLAVVHGQPQNRPV